MSFILIGRQARVLAVVGMSSLLAPSSFPEATTFSTARQTSPDRRVAEEAFRTFNAKVPDRTIETFMKVITAYELERVYEPCIHQLCLESALNPTAVSSGSAIGLCQITPTTAFDVLHRINPEERVRMKRLGATSIAWAINGEYTTRTDTSGKTKKFIAQPLREKAITWLKDPENNLILWGYIMHDNLHAMSTERAFLAYRLGNGAIRRYKGKASKHPYMVGMDRIRKLLQKKKGAV